MLLLAILALCLPLAAAGPDEDAARLGQNHTDVAIYRSGGGTNVISIGLGDPVQDFNLTISTNIELVLVASDACDNCLEDAPSYIPDDSRSLAESQRALSVTTIFPTSKGAIDAVSLKGTLATERITDSRQDSADRVFGLINDVADITASGGEQTRSAKLPAGVSGFFGLGIYRNTRQWSVMPSLQQVGGAGAPAGVASFVVGFDIAKYNRNTGVQAGTMHFGGVSADQYTGNFNWIDANTSVAGSWGIDIDRLRVSGKVIDGKQYYASLDPGFDAIYVPERVAEDLFSAVSDATRDTTDTTRWNVPCDAEIPMTVTIGDREYNVESSQLVQQRGVSPGSCWSSIVSWQAGGLPDAAGEIRLGTPFLSGVYAAIYYAEKQQFVGLAGKPGSVNDFNALAEKRGKPNTKLAGILIGSLLAVLLVALIGCYARNRHSFQSVWYRGIRRQHRAQVNMMVRAATIPPPMIGASMVIPPPMMGGMGGMGPMGPMGVPPYMPVPMGPGGSAGGFGRGFGMGRPMMGQMGQEPGGGWQQGPPMYQAPMQQHQQPGQQHAQGGRPHPGPFYPGANQPPSVEHTPRGQYSSRRQSLPLPQIGADRGQTPKPPRYSHPLPPNHTRSHRVRPDPVQDYGPQHGDVGPDQLHGLLEEHDLGDNRYPTQAAPRRHNQKLHFGGIETRQERPRQQGGGGPPSTSEPSMIQRDRMAAEQERIEADKAAHGSIEPTLPPNHPLVVAREAEARQRAKDEKRKRRSWRSWASRDKGDRLHIPSFQSETGIDPEAEYEARRIREFDPPPKPSSTWIKSTYEHRLGHASWRRAERERNRRTQFLGKGMDGPSEDGMRRQ